MQTVPINDKPISVWLDAATGVFSPCPQHTFRRVGDLSMMFQDRAAVADLVKKDNPVVYEIRYYPFATSRSDMALGVSTILPGRVGNEYFFTKGHFHERDDQPEIYHCVQGSGVLQMETRDGEYQFADWKPGTITHIPPAYAHRVVNTGNVPLVFVASFHLSAGHVYGPIESRGFSRIIVEQDGVPTQIPNPARK